MKKLSVFFLILSLLLCFSLFLGFLLLPPAQPGANEVFADKPALLQKDGSFNDGYFADIAQYYAQRFGFRQELITANAKATAVLGSSASEDVLLGKDGWLYYASTLSDFTGAERMTNRALFAAANNLALIQDSCELGNISFAFLPIPNKNTLYPEHMGEYGVVSQTHDLDRLEVLLSQMGVPVIDAEAAFASQAETLYFAHDSHWNSKGAALGADLIAGWCGKETSYFGGDFSASIPHTGDLFEMLYPLGADEETDPQYGGTLTFDYAAGSGKAPDSITIRTESKNSGSLMLYRDSFGNLLYPYIADSFGYVVFSRSNTYSVPENFDTLIIELVERNLPYLIRNLPAVAAPERTIRRASPEGTAVLTCQASPVAGCLLWQGDASQADETSPVYLLTADTAYRTFLLENGKFAAHLPGDAQVTGISYCVNGSLAAFGAEVTEVTAEVTQITPEVAPEISVPEETEAPQETEAPTQEPEIDEALLARMDAARACIDQSVEVLYAAIGEPISSDYASSCLGSGEDGNLYYDGFTVYTYREGDTETVRYVD